ncbi:MAG: acyl-ACP--UDP-N-acetylglucosamine O-acyltransferase [Desulfobacterales bacterium]|jgi:UDP-N-acetylglucosamine acyltransferase|nr:acyl-[acyl-carrier-protein]--UDP-N-acetylglucosamine O-acyltransferase [Desulfobacter sp.]MDP6395838.1 acyl-ACP--UDP-N-acetylglucosamine O-acyltransferase [Desulfobacterales bacterium]MDP6681428.1 acyl-ACP--UDP-N-acetylglucosamine O-acyltransferase [Desulfobacterales bacterium]MDP6806570.1 acyl-ACP--UDP-N-acetylglucosamine O-acyltransferase [Desulfobacterales bacterium]|tara:strand:- start:30134 stop:30904 length:771 start_codon:yes stop_codon:yes gene_type:complete
MIHPTAIIDPKAELDTNIEIGPYTIIKENTFIGSETMIGSHVVIEPFVHIRPECQIFQYAAIGAVPQSVKFKGEETYVKVGRGTIIREFVTIHRGTEFGGGVTEVGEENFVMAYSHIAHDCKTGRQVMLSNNATLGGHITIGDYSTIGGLVAIHQFVRIGDYAFVGGKSAVVKDVPPYVIAAGDRAALYGLNSVGLRRHGFSQKTLSLLKKTYRIVFRIGLTLNESIERLRAEVEQIPEVVNFIDFIKSSQRGLTR